MPISPELDLTESLKILRELLSSFNQPKMFFKEDILYKIENLIPRICSKQDQLSLKQKIKLSNCLISISVYYLNNNNIHEGRFYIDKTFLLIKDLDDAKENAHKVHTLKMRTSFIESVLLTLESEWERSNALLIQVIDVLKTKSPCILFQKKYYMAFIIQLLENHYCILIKSHPIDLTLKTFEKIIPLLETIFLHLSDHKKALEKAENIFTQIIKLIDWSDSTRQVIAETRIKYIIKIANLYNALLKKFYSFPENIPSFIIQCIQNIIHINKEWEHPERIQHITRTIEIITLQWPLLLSEENIQPTTIKELFFSYYQTVKKTNDPNSIIRAIKKMEAILTDTLKNTDHLDQIESLFICMFACIQDIQNKFPQQSHRRGEIFFCKFFYDLIKHAPLHPSQIWYETLLAECNLHAPNSPRYTTDFFISRLPPPPPLTADESTSLGNILNETGKRITTRTRSLSY